MNAARAPDSPLLRGAFVALLHSRTPIAVFEGTELAAFYNEALRSFLRRRGSEALPESGDEGLNEVATRQLRAAAESVLRSGESTLVRDVRWVTEVGGLSAEITFDVSCDAVRDESGTSIGVLCVATETTERFIGERRLALLSDLAAAIAGATTEEVVCAQAMRSLEGRPDVPFAALYAGDIMLGGTPGASQRMAATPPEWVKSVPLVSPVNGRACTLVVGVDPAQPFDDAHAKFLGLLAVLLTKAIVSARAKDADATASAVRAKAYLAAIVDSAEDAIIAKDLNGIIQACNAAGERLFGYTAAEMIGRSVRMLIPPDRQSEEDDILARLRRGERVEHFVTVRMAKDGRRIDVALTISPVRDDNGTIIGASKIGRDITRQKHSESERLRLMQETAAITETLHDVGALVTSDLDRSKVVQAVTDKATELTDAEFGAFFYNVVDARGEAYTLYTISGVPREAFSKFPMPRNTGIFEPTFKGTHVVRSADITQDPQYGHNPPYHGMPRGHLPVRSYLAVPVKGRGGEVIGGLFFGHSEVGVFQPHHERIAVGIASWAAVALENARLFASVQEASRLKDEFLASLSHELRTPLNAILGYVRMLHAGMLSPDKQTKAIATIERNATSLTQIVEDVLDISRIVSGKIRLNVRSVDLPLVVQDAIDVIAPAADAKGVRVESVLDPQAGPISGDPERLQQVFWNLLSNGVKFTPRGGKLQVRLERINSHIELTVSDTGVGIAPEFLPHVFERFRQAEGGTTRERGGLGLGLAIAKQLAELHGGTIEASSAGVGQGSTFRVKIPLMVVHPTRDAEPRVHPRAPSAPANLEGATLQGAHVLIVDDEPDALSLIGEVLETVGARITIASSAEQALSRLDVEVPDVVITDLGMPRMDGFQLMERIRQHPNPRVRELPAAALTAYARSEDRVKALQAGFQIHLAKPIDPAELVTTVAALAKRVVVRTP